MGSKVIRQNRTPLAVGLLIALAGSAWTIGAIHAGPVNIGRIGVAWYSVLLICLFTPRVAIVARFGSLLSLGMHAVFLLALINLRYVCVPCLLSTAGAFLAGGVILASGRARMALLVTPLGVALGMAAVFLAFQRIYGQVKALEAQARSAGNPPAGHVRLVVYGNADDADCDEFLQDRLPALQKEYSLDVESHPSAADLPAPTIILVSDAGKSTTVLGDAPIETFEQAIKFVRQ